MAGRGRKPWELTDDETLTTYQNWQSTMTYNISLDNKWSLFLPPDGKHHTWNKLSATHKTRGLTDDGQDVEEYNRHTASQKNTHLELMLGYIAGFAPVLSRNSIVKNSVSLNDIWQQLRSYYGFASTGAQFLDLATIRFQNEERPEKLYQRLRAFFEDNLLTATCGVTHHGAAVVSDEELTPSVENTITFLWLQLIHPGLPNLVKQKYGADLRHKTLSSIKPEISLAMNSLRDELNSIEVSQVNRTGSAPFRPRRFQSNNNNTRTCILCKTAKRPFQHDLQECRFLPDGDRRRFARSRAVELDDDYVVDQPQDMPESLAQDTDELHIHSALLDIPSARRVAIIPSPTLMVYFGSHALMLTIDTGATTTLIQESVAQRAGLPIKPATQTARQADGRTPLSVIGEVHCQVNRGRHTFQLSGLVVKELDSEVLAGTPFLVTNDIATRPAKNQIVLRGTEVISYYHQTPHATSACVSRVDAFVCRNGNRKATILPGDYIDLAAPPTDRVWAVEPRYDSITNQHTQSKNSWPAPQLIHSVGGNIRLVNTKDTPLTIGRSDHVCKLLPVTEIPKSMPCGDVSVTVPNKVISTSPPYSAQVTCDPQNILGSADKAAFNDLIRKHDTVFNPAISMYNGKSGDIKATVNMGPTLPPQRKGRLPQYNKSMLSELQAKFDELESQGVFTTPEKAGVTVEYLNISFLVRKNSGGHRLVTSFGEVGSYSKPQPSLMPNVDQVLRDIASWRYIIVTDLLQSFYQIPLAHDSKKYCGVVTPFKGIRVYQRSAMGMPGSETSLEELMSRVLGDLIQQGRVVKLADDLYCGGNSPKETLENFQLVLEALQRNNLRLSARKTIICPKTTTILGWTWSAGTLQASPHRINTLSAVEPPETVQSLRSFIGAYKVLSRVLPSYAYLMHPLDQAVAGRQSSEKIQWNDELLKQFNLAKLSLKDSKTITLPRPSDVLWIVTDGAIRPTAIGATLYILRDKQLHLAGFFNAKLKKHQVTWLPCEIEALGIAIAIKHFSPYVVQSDSVCQVLTDSKPCVEGYNKLKRGEFSNSSRVATFLTMVSRYQINVRHIRGESNLPSDYSSRHPITCPDNSCQLCKFISATENSVIQAISVKDVLEGNLTMPFTSRAAWRDTQLECPDLRRAHAHLTQGTRPSKKTARIKDTRRYLMKVTIATDGLLVFLDESPFTRVRERIVIPRSVLDGLLTALHLKFDHPTQHQLKSLFTRYFFALNTDLAISSVTGNCAHCRALKSFPATLVPQTSEPAPTQIGVNFAADVLRRHRQFILLLRETVSSFTQCILIESERQSHLHDGLVILLSKFTSFDNKALTVRVDACPAFQALTTNANLLKLGVTLVLGHTKNVNKNPVAERAVQELGIELLKLCPEGGAVSIVDLSIATARLNSRIRDPGLSAQELWTQRDQCTGSFLPLSETAIIEQQQTRRQRNHSPSARSKAQSNLSPVPELHTGQLVMLKSERDKSKPRERYMIMAVNNETRTYSLRKFTRSQFRSKLYEVKSCDCYPVQPSIPPNLPPLRPTEPESSDSSDNEELDYPPLVVPHDLPPPNAIIDAPPPPPPAITDALPPPPSAITDAPPPVATMTPPVSDNTRQITRPKRDTRAPSRYSPEDWIMD